MSKYLLGVVILLATMMTASCEKEKICDAAKVAAGSAAAAVAKTLECKNVDAIKEDLLSPVYKAGICEEDLTGVVGDLICPQISKYVVDLSKKAIPADWECNAAAAGDNLFALINTQCKSIIKY
mgnify:CR=1 FL=1